jgi:hypothetical protein
LSPFATGARIGCRIGANSYHDERQTRTSGMQVVLEKSGKEHAQKSAFGSYSYLNSYSGTTCLNGKEKKRSQTCLGNYF